MSTNNPKEMMHFEDAPLPLCDPADLLRGVLTIVSPITTIDAEQIVVSSVSSKTGFGPGPVIER